MSVSLLDLSNCVLTANTGSANCATDPGIIRRFLAVPVGTVISPGTILATDWQTEIQDSLWEGLRAKRWFLSPLLTNLDDKTEDTKEEDRDSFKVTTQQPPYNWGWLMNCTSCDHKHWLSFQFTNNYEFYLIDDNGVLWGTLGYDTDLEPALRGFSIFEFFVKNWKQRTTSTANQYMVRLKMANNAQFNANMRFINAGLIPEQLQGLIDVVLTPGVTDITPTHIYVSGKAGCGASSIGVSYGDTLAAASAWAIVDKTTLAPIVPSAVAYDPVNDEYDLTVSTTTTGDKIQVGLAAADVMTASPFFLNIITETPNTFTYTSL